MNVLLQGLLVAVVVMLCACYSIWRLLPARLRLRAHRQASAHLPRIGASAWLTAWRTRALSRPRRRLRLLRAGCYERGFPETNTWWTSPFVTRSVKLPWV